jgi:hypothetical protein
MSVALAEEDKARIRHHMGYLQVVQVQTFVAGFPAAVQSQFAIEGAMDKVLPSAVPRLTRILDVMDGIEEQMVADQELLAVTQVGEIQVRPDEFKQLQGQYVYWQRSLANLLAVEPNQYDQRFMNAGLNVPVRHG